MFENTPPQSGLPSSAPSPMPGMPTSAPSQPAPMPQPKVFTMPEKFRSTGGSPKSGGSRGTKRLMIILIIVTVVAGLTVGGLYVFNNVLNQDTANDNANTNTVVDENLNVVNTNTADENLNSGNSNLNGVTNENTNVTANLNSSLNSNGNTNSVVTNTNASTNGNTNTSTVATSPLPSSTDTDADGLTDIEETVYGTNASQPDSDGDSFIDGKKVDTTGTIGEVFNGYNPAGDGRLEGSALVKRQENAAKEYSLLLPTPWTAVTDSAGGVLINPSQSTGELFQVRVDANPSKLTPQQWYLAANPSANAAELTSITVNALEGLYSEDQSTVYLFRDTKVYMIQYSTGSLTQVNYRTTFDMIVRSFKLVAAS